MYTEKPLHCSYKILTGRLVGQARRTGIERLSFSQDIFFPWSSKPMPSFARNMAGRAMKTALNKVWKLNPTNVGCCLTFERIRMGTNVYNIHFRSRLVQETALSSQESFRSHKKSLCLSSTSPGVIMRSELLICLQQLSASYLKLNIM